MLKRIIASLIAGVSLAILVACGPGQPAPMNGPLCGIKCWATVVH